MSGYLLYGLVRRGTEGQATVTTLELEEIRMNQQEPVLAWESPAPRVSREKECDAEFET